MAKDLRFKSVSIAHYSTKGTAGMMSTSLGIGYTLYGLDELGKLWAYDQGSRKWEECVMTPAEYPEKK